MILIARFVTVGLLGLVISCSAAQAQEAEEVKERPVLDGSDISRELHERQQKVESLSDRERELLQIAYQKAAEDPDVKAAADKRQEAIDEFQRALRKSLIEADPSVEPLLERLARQPRQ